MYLNMRNYWRLTVVATVTAGSLSAADLPYARFLMYLQSAKEVGATDDAVRAHARATGRDPKLAEEAVTPPISTRARTEAPPRTNVPADYRIGAGDVILVSVWREPDASQEVTVRSDGKVSLPLIKEVELAGLTPSEAERMLSEKFDKMIPGADVTLIIRAVNSRKVYLVGAVRTVGSMNMTSTLTVLQAIAQAGGLTDFAKKKQIYILRNDGGKQVRLTFNYESVVKGERMEQNIVLQPDDTIVVPQ
jgi:polysaccharide export outer membrane protein